MRWEPFWEEKKEVLKLRRGLFVVVEGKGTLDDLEEIQLIREKERRRLTPSGKQSTQGEKERPSDLILESK